MVIIQAYYLFRTTLLSNIVIADFKPLQAYYLFRTTLLSNKKPCKKAVT